MGHLVQLDDFFAVYGSLMSGLSGSWAQLIAQGLVRVGPCRIPGVLYDLGAYPGLVHGEGNDGETVAGELYRVVRPEVFDQLDEYEDFHPERPEASLYLRERVALPVPPVQAWVYIYAGSVVEAQRVAGGDWRQRLAERMTQDGRITFCE